MDSPSQRRIRLRRVLLVVDESHFPTVRAVVMETGNAAGIEMKGAIVIQMGGGDAAKDAQDRKVMANNHDTFRH